MPTGLIWQLLIYRLDILYIQPITYLIGFLELNELIDEYHLDEHLHMWGV